MNAQELETSFGIAGALHFEETPTGLVHAQIATADCTATIYTQGAHLTHWQPAGASPVLFTGGQNSFAAGKAIRGGVPVIFPWFGAHTGQKQPGVEYPAHGFARTMEWKLTSAAQQRDAVQLIFTLTPDEQTRVLGFDHFYVEYSVRVGKELTMEITVRNDGAGPLHFEEALHTYFAVEDVRRTSLHGLGGAAYLDSTDAFALKQQTEPMLRFMRRTDSVYIDTAATCVIHDEAQERQISVAKTGSQTTVVWNPGAELARTLPELGPDEWCRFLCVETANAHGNAVNLPPGARHTMTATITLPR